MANTRLAIHDGRVPDLDLPLPMLATAGQPPRGDRWAFEFKWDGVRAVTRAASGRVRAQSRLGRDITSHYPEVAALAEHAEQPIVVDGELVVLNPDGRPDFGALQHRMHVATPGPDRLRQWPVVYYVFDLLRLGDRSLLAEPYNTRRALLDELDLEVPPTLRVPPCYRDVAGAELLEVAAAHGLEGVVGKRLDSAYHPGRRSRSWIKTPLRLTQEVVVGGWTEGEGRRAATLGSLLLGVYNDDGRLVYAGHVGTGMNERQLRETRDRLEPLQRSSSPFDTEVPREHARRAHWVEPVLVGEVEHRQWTGDGRLRHPSWRGVRVDKKPSDVRRV